MIEGLNWFANFQIQQMKRKQKKDSNVKVFITKLEKEKKQTQYVIYKEF